MKIFGGEYKGAGREGERVPGIGCGRIGFDGVCVCVATHGVRGSKNVVVVEPRRGSGRGWRGSLGYALHLRRYGDPRLELLYSFGVKKGHVL